MGSGWSIVAFPVILPWRDEFWTLPLYFPDLKVGVTPGWPTQLPYQGMPLPKEAEVHPRELRHYKPGDFRQWQAFENYRKEQGEEGDLIQAIKGYGQPAAPAPSPSAADAWSLAWQLEKMQADQEAQLLLVDKGEDWLKDVLKPERWEDPTSYGPVSGVEEMVDPELAELRYLLWRRVMQPFLENQAAPLLLGRTSRSLFLTLKGWPDWTGLKTVRLGLPGCRNRIEWQGVAGDSGKTDWQDKFLELLGALLTGVADHQDLHESSQELQEFISDVIVARWPYPAVWNWDLEIWGMDGAPDEKGPILCWAGAGEGILPG
ncbi:MAG: hypothetical protein ACOZFS_00960 [Thermodesulfobacteriota bacterium]